MKLEENNYTDKNGVERVTYKVKKLNEYGKGITVDTKIDFELYFQPVIKPITFIDKKTKTQKSFDSVKITAKPSVEFENVVLHEQYGTASFQLPTNYSQWIADCKKGDVITVWLRSFTIQEDGEEVNKNTWDCLINGKNPKFENNEQKKTMANSTQKFNMTQKESKIPKQLNDWLSYLVRNKKEFNLAFENNYDLFCEWIRSAIDCGTDYYVDKSDAEIQALYKELKKLT